MGGLNFELKDRRSSIVGREFTEKADAKIVRQLIKTVETTIPTLDETKKSELKAYNDLLSNLKNILRLSVANGGSWNTSYTFGKGKKRGRVFNMKSLGHLWAEVKSAIFGLRPELQDIDMVNGGYTVLYQIGVKLGCKLVDLKPIKDYIDKREQYLQNIRTIYKVSKGLAKLLFITLSYGGSVDTWISNNSITNIRDEKGKKIYLGSINDIIDSIGKIGQKYIETYPKILKKISSDNIYGSAAAEIYQDTENRCLEILLVEFGFPKEAYLQHDGATLNMDEVYESTGLTIEQMLETAHFNIQQELGIDVKYEVKKFSEPMELSDLEDSTDEEFIRFENDRFNNYLTNGEKKRYFEIFHFKTGTPNVRYIYQKFSRMEQKNNIYLFEECELKKKYRNLFIEVVVEKGGKNSKEDVLKKTPFIDWWITQQDLREYDGFDFIPENKITDKLQYWDGISEENFNSFRGYSKKCFLKRPLSKDEKMEKLEPWLEIVHELCGGVKEHTDAYLNYLAHMIQKPNEKVPVAFVIKSAQGVGKNMTLEPIGKILNEYFISSGNIDDFVGDYANGFFQKILVNLNECQMTKKGFDYEGRIKAFITEDTSSLNEKHEKRRTVRNIARLIIFTNKPNPLAMDVKTINRRFFVFQSTEEFLGMEDEFWTERLELFSSDEFVAILYDFLNTRDISNAKWKPIITPAYIEMCSQFIPLEVLFLEDFFTYGEHSMDNNLIKSDALYRYYVSFAERMGVKKEMIASHPKFTLLLKDLQVGITTLKKDGYSHIAMNLAEVRKNLILKQLIRPNDGEEVIQQKKKYKKLSDYKRTPEDDSTTDESSSVVSSISEDNSVSDIETNLIEDDESNDFINSLFQ
jgi:hypothetical protein